MDVRRLEKEQVHVLRDLRLRALSDAADLLDMTFAESASQPARYWEEFAGSITDVRSGAMLVAFDDSVSIGCVYTLCDSGWRGFGRICGMWVEPIWRRRGVGRAMLQEIINWALHRELKVLQLWAPETPAALGLYGQAGFRATGNTAPSQTGSDI